MNNNKIILNPHQIKPIEFIKSNFGILIYHSVGSGKTITAISCAYQFINDIIIIGTKSSKKTFIDDIEKLKLNKDRFTHYTFSKIKDIIYENFELFNNKTVIIDEAHHLRTETKNTNFLFGVLSNAHRIILLTATPIVNYLNDISLLVNLVKNDIVLPNDKELFNFLYFDEINLSLRNINILSDKLKNCISYYKKNNNSDYPKSIVHFKHVVMNIDQINKYTEHVRRIIYNYQTDESTNMFDIKFDFMNKGKKNTFLMATRMISNTVDNKTDTPKIVEITKLIKNGPFPIVIYSNFLENGIFTMANVINELGIKFKMITGRTLLDNLISTVNEYNERKFDILLLSSAGSESITLKNTRQLHIMEPHFNDAKINQVIGRVIRYKSHDNLPINEKIVNIYHWVSTFPDTYSNMSADEYLIDLSRSKSKIIQEFDEILINSSIENN